jgi:hypothetical protein
VAATPVCGTKEDVPVARLVVVMVLPARVTPTAEVVSGTGMPASCATPAARPWGPPPSEVP